MTPATKTDRESLSTWMKRVLKFQDEVTPELSPEPVHELRVALRRCISVAREMEEIDPEPAWKEMRKEGKRLFGRLGALRDAQVMKGWAGKLSAPDDAAREALLDFLDRREQESRAAALEALEGFDRGAWKSLVRTLPQRFARIELDGAAGQQLALERLQDVAKRHASALRRRSAISYHRLRIALKRFRYLVENFLPQRHAEWGADLKQLQDLLGEANDLDVLWQTALESSALEDSEARAGWRTRIRQERRRRLQNYRDRMSGKDSLLTGWRAGLPLGEELEAAGLAKLTAWAQFLCPDLPSADHIERLALELYDGLANGGLTGINPDGKVRNLLRAAALLRDVGHAKGKKAHHKSSYRLIRRLTPPMGWSARDMEVVALVARYHRGALPDLRHKGLSSLPPAWQQATYFLAGILRLANACKGDGSAAIRHLQVRDTPGELVIHAEGYVAAEPLASKLATAKHLLEISFHRPVRILDAPPGPARAHAAAAGTSSSAA